MPGKSSPRIDFLIGNTAVEFAVRRPWQSKAPLSDRVNSDEIKKLMLHDGLSVLILYDFSRYPLEEEDIERFREWPSLGKGNFRKSAFNVSYHFIKSPNPLVVGNIRKNIRV
jgi:hypothetical protein